MAATSQPYRHNNAITAFTIWGNTFAGSRWGRINSLGRATYGRLPLNSQGVPSKLPLAPHGVWGLPPEHVSAKSWGRRGKAPAPASALSAHKLVTHYIIRVGVSKSVT